MVDDDCRGGMLPKILGLKIHELGIPFSTNIRIKYKTYSDIIPVVPHKAVAEVSKIGNYRRDELL